MFEVRKSSDRVPGRTGLVRVCQDLLHNDGNPRNIHVRGITTSVDIRVKYSFRITVVEVIARLLLPLLVVWPPQRRLLFLHGGRCFREADDDTAIADPLKDGVVQAGLCS